MADIAVREDGAGAGPAPRTGRPARLAASVSAALAAEGERRILWLPVWFGCGIALYFGIM